MAAPVSARQAYPPARTAWYMVGVLMLCYTLSYADRQILAFLVEPLKHDLEISDTQFGLLQGAAFALVYTFFGLPMGALADRLSRRNLVAIGVFVWSLATSVSSVARSFLALGAARMGVGLGEATLSPCAFSMITDSFPKERLSTALSVYTMGIQLGSGLALVIGGVVAQAVSHMHPIRLPGVGFIAAWRVTFLIVGAPGLLVTLLMMSVREPARRALLLDAGGQAAQLRLTDALAQIRARWRSVAGIAAMISCQATCNYVLLTWGPAFFERMHHWPKDRTGLVLGLTTLGCGSGSLRRWPHVRSLAAPRHHSRTAAGRPDQPSRDGAAPRTRDALLLSALRPLQRSSAPCSASVFHRLRLCRRAAHFPQSGAGPRFGDDHLRGRAHRARIRCAATGALERSSLPRSAAHRCFDVDHGISRVPARYYGVFRDRIPVPVGLQHRAS